MRQPLWTPRAPPGSQPHDGVMRFPRSATTAEVAQTRRPCLGLTHLAVHGQMTPRLCRYTRLLTGGTLSVPT
jgi:hypothetical protein